MNKLRERLEEKCVSQSKLASKLSISKALLSRYIKGDRDIPLKRAKKIADFLGYSIEDIFFVKDNLNNNNESNNNNLNEGKEDV
jgi:transcriptional regulator with XRE-family HTH domain